VKVDPVSPAVRRRQNALAAWHDRWSAQHTESAPFTAEGHPAGSDYNQHHIDVEADGEAEDQFHRRARRIMGVGA
jgi:hypothetical protein